MPSYEKDKRVRLPSISSKMYAIRGLATEEKEVLIRLGNLIDSYVMDREQNNPDGEARTLDGTRIPTPQSIDAIAVTGGIQVTWTPVNMKRLKQYEVQYSSTSTFAESVTIPTFDTRIILKNLPATTLWIRVRAVDRRGRVSLWGAPSAGSVTYGDSPFEVDSDYIDPENRTFWLPKPETVGADLAVGVGSRVFFGVGAAIGPGPISFIDNSGQFYSSTNKHQITYSVLENEVRTQYGTVGLPTGFIDLFYDTVFREYMVGTGSFINFFYVDSFTTDPTSIDIRFLDYLFNLNNDSLPHEQTGTVNNATVAIVKH
jgi:hypothetical protein